jgi:hypothetical protein
MKMIDEKIAWSIATDEANRHMKKQGRIAWNQTDYNIAIECFNRLWPMKRR